MQKLDLLRDLLDGPSAPTSLDETIFVLRDHLSLKHVAYLATHMPPLTRTQIYRQVTYSDEWVSRYLERSYVDIDPVLPAAFNSIIPVDWGDVNHSSSKIADFFRDADHHDVGRQGLTIPIRGALGERAFFSVTLDASESEWSRYINDNIAVLQIIAFYYHKKVLQNFNLQGQNSKLTPRQTEVLTWLARGKSMKDVATIMGLSVHTVHAYVETVRAKLGALNITHAVAKALQQNLIFPPDG
ncbi:MAG: LuxR family transcriptional regulator [Beijerinckiaceae bacterium]|jgi:DNA-binding CsgD family transcriptional regulator|nr:LuxR family transcriptional regulator [Beijerinckiaceae bacterium]